MYICSLSLHVCCPVGRHIGTPTVRSRRAVIGRECIQEQRVHSWRELLTRQRESPNRLSVSGRRRRLSEAMQGTAAGRHEQGRIQEATFGQKALNVQRIRERYTFAKHEYSQKTINNEIREMNTSKGLSFQISNITIIFWRKCTEKVTEYFLEIKCNLKSYPRTTSKQIFKAISNSHHQMAPTNCRN